MPKRTIRDARHTLDDLRPTASDFWLKQWEAEVKAASGRAVAGANDYADARMQDAEALRQEVLADLASLRDAFSALTAAGEVGEVPAADYARQLVGLQHAHRRLRSRLAELDNIATSVEAIEEDPEGWFDQTFYAKYAGTANQLLPNFTF